nr:hypothetical protein [Chitinophagales bacterium]
TGSNQMQTGLNFQPLIPTTQPYNTAPWNYAGTESYTGTLPTTVIDWVLVELMNIVNNDNFTVQGRKAALLLSNGKIVDPTWTTNNAIDGVLFDGAFTGQTLSVAVRHRNHLAIVSANPVALPNATTVDLSIANNVMGGSAQLKLLGSEYCMLAGDYDANGTITVADFNGYATESSGINNYFKADFNLDKNVTVADFNLYKPNSSKIGVKPIRY